MKKEWLEKIKGRGHKFFVLKCQDFLDSMTEEEVELFNLMLHKHEEYRESLNKHPINEYYVVNKDDVPHIKTKEEFLKIVGYEKTDI